MSISNKFFHFTNGMLHLVNEGSHSIELALYEHIGNDTKINSQSLILPGLHKGVTIGGL